MNEDREVIYHKIFVPFNSRNKVYASEDHLLSVEGTIATEEYKKIYFKDINGIVCRKTNNYMALNIGTIIFMILGFLPIILGGSELFVITLFIVIPIGIILGINLLLGSSCETFFITDTGKIRIPALARYKRVDKVLKKIVPLVGPFQKQFMDQEIMEKVPDPFDEYAEQQQ